MIAIGARPGAERTSSACTPAKPPKHAYRGRNSPCSPSRETGITTFNHHML